MAILLLLLHCLGDPLPAGPDSPVDFERDVRPLLSDRCFVCHGPDAAARRADLRLDQREDAVAAREGPAAVVPGDSEHSLLIRRIESEDPRRRMPPPDSGLSLSADERRILRRWIDEGATWNVHWSLRPVERPEVPELDPPPRSPIDAFLQARLDEEGLEPSPPAPPEEWLRRVQLELTGLPPTLEELEAFLADPSPAARERVVDELLSRPGYGERMALPWLDAARYADTNGYQGDGTRSSWPWRDWVVRAFNDNLPFDRFTVEQLAGDLLPDAGLEQVLATGFHRNHMLNGEGGRIAEESRVESVMDRVSTTGTVWLGLTVACAQCHDHKYDPISQREYYGLYAFFNSIDESGAVDAGGNARPVMRVPSPEQREQLARLDDRIEQGRRALEASLAPSPERRARWERATRDALPSSRGAPWITLAPTQLEAEQSVEFRALDDGSTLLAGPNPDRNDLRLQLLLEPGRWSALRLEALPHPQHTNAYLARSNSGNFVLSGLRAQLETEDGVREIRFSSAVADYTQSGFDVAGVLDDDPETGWAVHGDPDFGPHQARLRLAEPLELDAPTVLHVQLEHRSRHARHVLGRFRLSVSEDPEAALDAASTLGALSTASLQKDPGARSPEERAALDAVFLARLAPDPQLQDELDELRRRRTELDRLVPETMVMREREEPRRTYLLMRGVYDQPDTSEELPPSTPALLPPLPPGERPDRLALARWLVDPAHPLTARVTVNRFWQQVFGTGLVRTSEDFGVQGERPSHPRLLDWLAAEFVASGWDVKALMRSMVLSEAYARTAARSAPMQEQDPDNRLLAHGPRRRLSSFALRDQALFLGGLLVPRVGGPPVNPYQPEGVWAEATFGQIRFQLGEGEELYRRSLYTFWRRIVGPTGLFDTTARQACSVRKEITNTPLHALTTLNDVTYVEAARGFAARCLAEPGSDPDRLHRAFRRATSRAPRPDEHATLQHALDEFRAAFRARPNDARVLIEVGASAPPADRDPVELAAWTQLCHLLLNLDECLSS